MAVHLRRSALPITDCGTSFAGAIFLSNSGSSLRSHPVVLRKISRIGISFYQRLFLIILIHVAPLTYHVGAVRVVYYHSLINSDLPANPGDPILNYRSGRASALLPRKVMMDSPPYSALSRGFPERRRLTQPQKGTAA